MDDPVDEHESRRQLPEAGSMVEAWADAMHGMIAKANAWFWLTFVVLFIASLFVPIFPLYKGSYIIMRVPVWAVYAFGSIAPLFAVPIIVLHVTFCFYVARFTFPYGEHTRSISLISMMILVSVSCVFIAMVVRFQGIGLVATFLVFAISISSANLFTNSRFCGVIYPRLSLGVARILFWLSCTLAVFSLIGISVR